MADIIYIKWTMILTLIVLGRDAKYQFTGYNATLWRKQQPRPCKGLYAQGDPGSNPTRNHFPIPLPTCSLQLISCQTFTILSDLRQKAQK